MTIIPLQYLLWPSLSFKLCVTQTMAAIELAASSIFSSPPSSSSYLKFPLFPNSIKLQNYNHSLNLSLKSILYPLPLPSRKQCTQLHCSAVEVTEPVTVQEEKTEKPQKNNQRRKLFVLNLPWSLTVADIKNIFAECGIVDDVEVFFFFFWSLCMFIWLLLKKRC